MTTDTSPIDEPLRDAYDGIVFRAVLSFVAVACIAAVPLLLHLPPDIHAAAHAVVPALWVAYAGITWLRLRGMAPITVDPWERAAETGTAGAWGARLALVALPVGWMAAAIGLLAHHLSTTGGLLQVLGIDAPVLAASWLLATLAWRASCRAAVAAAASERSRRLRNHLEGLGRGH